MSYVAGIDLSTVALDLVLIDEDGKQPRAYTYELGAGDIVERIRTIGTTWPSRHSSIWDDVLAIGIERPAGRFGVAQVSMAFGAVLAMLPTDRVVKPWQPSEWRIAVGIKGNASKAEILIEALAQGALDWPRQARELYGVGEALPRTALNLGFPPRYTELIGAQLLQHIQSERAA